MLTRLKMLRLQRGARLLDVARMVGIGESLLSKIETRRNRATADLQAKLGLVFGVGREELFEDGGDAKLVQ